MTVWNCSCSWEAYKMCERNKLKKIKKIEDVIINPTRPICAFTESTVKTILQRQWTVSLHNQFYPTDDHHPLTSPSILFMHIHDLSPAILLRKETSLAGNSDRGGLLKRCVLVHSFCRNKHEFIPALCSKQGQVHIAPFIGITARFHNTPDIPESILQLLHGEQFQAMPLPWIGLMLVIFLLFTRFAVLKVI